MAWTLVSCDSSGSASVDSLFGPTTVPSPVVPILSPVANKIIQQNQTVHVQEFNIASGLPGTNNGMSYTCSWATVLSAQVPTAPCTTLPGTTATFDPNKGILNWVPVAPTLGVYLIKIDGTSSSGEASVSFTVDVRLAFAGIQSINGINGNQMTLNWTANPNAVGYQILLGNAGVYSVYQTITNPETSSVTLINLVPLQLYTWRVEAVDVLGNLDENTASLNAVTTEVVYLLVSAGASQLSPGESTTVTVTLEDGGGNPLPTDGLNVGVALSGSGTSSGSFSAVTDQGSGVYTAVFTATNPGTVNPITASLPTSYYVQQAANMTVEPLQIEITASQSTLNPGDAVTLTAKLHDYTGALISYGGQGLAFSYQNGTSTGTISAATDYGNGTYTATFTGGTAGTAITLSASLTTASTIYSTANLTVDPFTIEVTSSLSQVSVTRTAALSARVKNWQGNYLTTGGQGLTFVVSGSPGIASVGTTTDQGNGNYVATLTAQSLGQITVTATLVPSYSVTTTAPVTVEKLRVIVTSSASDLMPGQSANLTGQVKDWQGNLVGVGGESLTFVATGGTSSGTIGSVTDQGNGNYTAVFTASSAGSALTVSSSITDSFEVDTTASVTVHPWQLSIAATASALAVGQSLTATLTVKDYLGNQASAGGQTVSFTQSGGTSSGTFGAVTDNGNGTYTTTYTATSPGTATTISASILQPFQVVQTASVTVQAIYLAVSTSQAQMNPGGTAYVYAQVQNSGGTSITTGSYSVTFSYSGGTSTGSFSAVTYMGSGLYRATFTGATGGTAVTINATTTTSYVVASTQTITVVPWNIVISAVASGLTVGQTTTITGQIKDYNGNFLTSGGSGLAMSLVTSGVGSLSAATDNGDGTYTATFQASGVGTTTIGGTLSSSYAVSTTPTMTVTALHILVTATQTSLNPGGGVTVQAQMRDSSGNSLTTGSYSVGFANSGGTSTGSFGTVTNLGAGAYTSVFTGNVAGTPTTVTANATVPYVVDGTVNLTVVPWKLSLVASSSTVTVGQSITVTLTIKDYLGNQATSGGQTVSFTQSGGTSSGTFSAVTDNGNGTYTATYAGTSIGTATTISASILQSYQVTQTASVTVQAIYLAVTTSQAQMNPGGTAYVYAQVQNSSGTAITTGSYPIAFSYSGGTSTGSFSAVTYMGSGLYRATFTGASGGTAVTINATSTTSYTVASTQTITVVPWNIVISAASSNVTVGLTTTITGQIKDYNGNFLTSGGSGLAMSLVTSGVGSLSAVTDNSNGTYTATFQATGVGTTTIGASLSSSYTVSVTPTMTVTAVHILVTATQTSLNPGGGVTIKAQMRDSAGNNLASGSVYTVGFTNSGGTSTGSFGSVTYLGLGAYSSTFTGNIGGTATTATANVSVPYVVDGTVNLTVVPWGIVITSTSSSPAISETPTLTAQVKDYQGNNVTSGGQGLSMALTTGGVGSISGTTDVGNGTYTATFTATAVGTTSVTASMPQSYTVSSAPTLTVGKLYITVTLGSGLASSSVNSGSTITATATLKNSAGTVVTGSGYNVSFFASGGSSTVTAASSVSLVSTGVYQISYQGVLAGSATTISASTTQTYTESATAALTVNPGAAISATNSGLTASASSVRSGQSVTVTATLRDAAGNGMPGLTGVTFSNTTGSGISVGSFGSTTDAGGGSYTATFTGTTIGTATTISVSYGGTTVTQTTGVTVTAGVPATLTLTGPTTVNSNTCTSAMYMSFYDSLSNPTTLPSATTFTPTGVGTGSFYQDQNCITPLTSITVSGNLSQSQNFYFLAFDPGTYSLSLSATGITQSPSALSLSVVGNVNWIGSSGSVSEFGSGNFSTLGKYDGNYSSPQGVTNDGTYLYATDASLHTITKICMLSSCASGTYVEGQVVGVYGRISTVNGSSPKGPNAGCTSVVPGNGVNAWCTGGVYGATGSGLGQLNTPVGIHYFGGYLYVADTGNYRIVKIDPSTGAMVGWTGLTSAATLTSPSEGTVPSSPQTCAATLANETTPGWCLGGTPLAAPSNFAYGSSGGGTTTSGNMFGNPRYITDDGTYLYVTDSADERVVVLNPTTGLVVAWMGYVKSNTGISCLSGNTPANGAFTDSWCTGGQATNATIAMANGLNIQWESPFGIAYYSDGHNGMIYIGDQGGDGRIIRYLAFNGGMTDAGLYLGWTGVTSGTISVANNPVPSGAAIATYNTVTYLTSTSCNTIGTGVSTNAWCYGGVPQNNGGITGVNSPGGINVNSANTEMYVTNNSNFINRLNIVTGVFNAWIGDATSPPSGGVSGCVSTAPGNPFPGWCTGGGIGTGVAVGSFYNPRDITNDGTYLYVTDTNQSRITKHTIGSGFTTGSGAPVGALGLNVNLQQSTGWSNSYTGLPAGSGTSNANQFSGRDMLMGGAYGITGTSSYIYVADGGNNRIVRFNRDTGALAGSIGYLSLSPTGGDPACIGALPSGMTPGWCTGGAFTKYTGEGFYQPYDVATDGTYLYVADLQNDRIVMIQASNSKFMGWTGYTTAAPSDSNFNYSACTGMSVPGVTPTWCLGGTPAAVVGGLTGGFGNTSGIVGFTDTDGAFYLIVADPNNAKLQKICATAAPGCPQGGGQYYAPGQAVGWVGTIGTAPTGSALGVSAPPTTCSVAAGTQTPGWCTGGAAANATTTLPSVRVNNGYLNYPWKMFIDVNHYLYVADSSAPRVLKFNATTGQFIGWIGNVSNTTGINTATAGNPSPGCASATVNALTPAWCPGGSPNGTASSAFSTPRGIWVDSTGTYLYISDSVNNSIEKYNASTGAFIGWKGMVYTTSPTSPASCTGLSSGSITPTWCVGGTSKFGYTTGSNASALDGPEALWGYGGYLYVVDTNNGRIVTIPTN